MACSPIARSSGSNKEVLWVRVPESIHWTDVYRMLAVSRHRSKWAVVFREQEDKNCVTVRTGRQQLM